MTAPSTTIWDLESHTRAKHEILRRYLLAWTPILTQGGFPQVLYIDGFAGPGRYSKGEPGSPIIALQAALEHQDKITSRAGFFFVEKDIERSEILQQIIEDIERPPNFRVDVAHGKTFEAAFPDLLGLYSKKNKKLPPTFAFIDPFGWAGVPFDIVRQILSCPSCEVLVTFMYEEINRFIGLPDQAKNFDVFFGTEEWREGIGLTDSRVRNRFLHDLYLRQLNRSAGAKYVRSFEMCNERDVTDYFLFYATCSLRGLQKMKEAMWRVDESGEFSFSDATNPNQLVLFSSKPRYDVLQRQIVEKFIEAEPIVGEIEEFVLSGTAFRETHYKKNVLKKLELAEPPMLEPISPAPGRRRGTYSDPSLRLRFLRVDDGN